MSSRIFGFVLAIFVSILSSIKADYGVILLNGFICISAFLTLFLKEDLKKFKFSKT